MKIVLFGDSLLKNYGKDRLLDFEAAVPSSDIYNVAVGGWDTNDGVKKAPFVSKLKANIVILGFGTNDAAPWKQVPLEKYLTNIKQISHDFAGSRIIFFLPPPVAENNGHADNYRRFPEVVKDYHDKAKQLLDEIGIEYIDSFKLFGELIAKGEDYHIEDGVHFNELGYETLTKEFTRIIRSK